MKRIEELNLPEECRYAEDHQWVKLDREKVLIGISDYAQDQLEEIIYVELPQVGEFFKKNQVFGIVESAKSVSDLYMPLGGEIVRVNSELQNSPRLVNTSPYDRGWMIEVKPSESTEIDALLTKEAYLEMLKKEID